MVTKALIGIGGTGLVAGAITTIYVYTKPKTKETFTISELIKEHAKGKTFLNNSNKSASEWTAIWEKYRSVNHAKGQSKGNDKWKLEDWDTKHSHKTSAPDSFVSACERQLNKEVKGIQDQEYTDFINWCSR